MHWLAHQVHSALLSWGYLAIVVGLIGEDAGLPLPGETVLILASFIAATSHQLSLWIIIPVGIVSAIVGDNAGYWVGRGLRRHLVGFFTNWLNMGDDVAVAEDMLDRHGSATIFWARFIFGARELAGPIAGALRMKWERFFLFNSLGACAWVVVMSLVGYAFSDEFNSFIGYFEKASWALAGGIFLIGYVLWRREKMEYRRDQARKQAQK